MLYGETFVSEYMGYDPELRKYSPGMFVLMRVIEGFCNHADGDIVRELDFGPGHAEYKGALCSRNWQEANVCIFSPTPKGVLLKSMRTATRVVDAFARRILTTTKLFPQLKRLWRDRLAKRGQVLPNTKKPAVDYHHNADRAEAAK
jgi:CelD/BcsL family acetyltransferase involved in cellulose biosynthesis